MRIKFVTFSQYAWREFPDVSLVVKDIDKSNTELSEYVYRFCHHWILVKVLRCALQNDVLMLNFLKSNLVPFPLKRGTTAQPRVMSLIQGARQSPKKTFGYITSQGKRSKLNIHNKPVQKLVFSDAQAFYSWHFCNSWHCWQVDNVDHVDD